MRTFASTCWMMESKASCSVSCRASLLNCVQDWMCAAPVAALSTQPQPQRSPSKAEMGSWKCSAMAVRKVALSTRCGPGPLRRWNQAPPRYPAWEWWMAWAAESPARVLFTKEAL